MHPDATGFTSASWFSHFFKFISWKMSTGAPRRHGNHTHWLGNRGWSDSHWSKRTHSALVFWRHTLPWYLTRTNTSWVYAEQRRTASYRTRLAWCVWQCDEVDLVPLVLNSGPRHLDVEGVFFSLNLNLSWTKPDFPVSLSGHFYTFFSCCINCLQYVL